MLSLKSSYRCLQAISTRLVHLGSQQCSAAKQSPLFVLRQKTGLAYSLCREALNKHNNNVEEAESWLKAQAMALGLEKANKVGGRCTKEGLISVATGSLNKEVYLLEVNCETDFVAKNQYFRDYIVDLTQQFVDLRQELSIESNENEKFIRHLNSTTDVLGQLSVGIVPLITKMGENIKINRATSIQAARDDVGLFGQVHAKAASKETDQLSINVGRFCAVVGLQDLDPDGNSLGLDRLDRAGRLLGQHVIGYNPTYLELPDTIRKHLEEAKRERAERLQEMQEMNQRNKKQDEEEKEESEHPRNEDEDIDWPSMMDQQLITSEELTVREYCKEKNISIVYFQRFEC